MSQDTSDEVTMCPPRRMSRCEVSGARGRPSEQMRTGGRGERVSAPFWSHCTVLRREDDSKPVLPSLGLCLGARGYCSQRIRV
eukprot:scaffold59440_cov47-Phaeocystis_antarctica.AAC.1